MAVNKQLEKKRMTEDYKKIINLLYTEWKQNMYQWKTIR